MKSINEFVKLVDSFEDKSKKFNEVFIDYVNDVKDFGDDDVYINMSMIDYISDYIMYVENIDINEKDKNEILSISEDIIGWFEVLFDS